MKYAVDRVENDVVILQNLSDGNMKEEKKETFPFKIKEKDIVIKQEDGYVLDLNAKKERIKLIKEKMNKLKSKE